MRNIWEDIFIDSLFSDIEFYISADNIKIFIIDDLRFRNEFDAVKSVGGKVILLKRPGHQHLTNSQMNHVSETELLTIPEYEFDYVISATNLPKLYAEIDNKLILDIE